MTDTPKKPGRPRKATAPNATTPQESPVQQSKAPEGTQVPDEAEIDVQRPAQLPTISVEELIQGMDEDLVRRVDAALARHMIRDHRMTWGEVRISLGYGNTDQDQAWGEIMRRVQ